MNKFIYALAVSLVLGTTAVFASPGDDGCVGNCSTEQGASNEQAQRQRQTANAGAIGVGIGAGGDSEASQKQRQTAVGFGGAGGVADSRSAASAGSSSSSVSEGSQAGAISGGNETNQGVAVDASDKSIVDYEYNYNNDYPVNTAASLYTNVCQQGVSGQGDDWGASAVFSDPLCDTLKVAAAYWDYHLLEHAHGNDEQAAYWKTKYVEQMKDVETLMESTKEVAIADRFAGFMIKPVALIALLVFLL